MIACWWWSRPFLARAGDDGSFIVDMTFTELPIIARDKMLCSGSRFRWIKKARRNKRKNGWTPFQRANLRVAGHGSWTREGNTTSLACWSGACFQFHPSRFSAITRAKSVKLSYEDRIKMRADLTQTRDHEKQMWNVVNEKRNVRQRCSLPLFIVGWESSL